MMSNAGTVEAYSNWDHLDIVINVLKMADMIVLTRMGGDHVINGGHKEHLEWGIVRQRENLVNNTSTVIFHAQHSCSAVFGKINWSELATQVLMGLDMRVTHTCTDSHLTFTVYH